MIRGTVTDDGTPVVRLGVAGRDWDAIIDTGFGGDLELPEQLRRSLPARWIGQQVSLLAAGQSVLEDLYAIDFVFDGQSVSAEATFVPADDILVGTRLMRQHHLTIDFPQQSLLLDRST